MDSSLSGAYSPGLIEAASVRSTSAPAPMRAYPGLIAPASLKRHAVADNRDHSNHLAGAGLSGAYSPGLIEAEPAVIRPSDWDPADAYRARLRRDLSGAYSPGLIEAGRNITFTNEVIAKPLIRGL